jgi:hypothetical protein
VNKLFGIVQLITGMQRAHTNLGQGIVRRRCSRRTTMDKRKLGTTGPNVSAIRLGCMGMSDAYGPADRGESIATIHAALDAGCSTPAISMAWATMKC